MFVVLVDFEIKPGLEDQFHHAMLEQAENSILKEPGCHIFDVCRDPESSSTFFLYEIYTDRAAFDVHLASNHFIAFDALVTDWVKSKSVRTLQRIGK
ncbi:putative quinol monooxygenase [Terasakiella sp. A23]|uniref:putative quinol monooxygenase n=1 Tax=Terasakiella sp. FCG-A23 TaxID=3080561 RepID=UPI0029536021|nr:putative quinol monooxygenase [Terasakiella sp. A23]MDV7340584.1 putative quinol monooxygenase [Terasakiella sp. A23]